MNVKIYISYHDRHRLIETSILKPIQTGCAVAEELFEGMMRDDEGENISAQNRKYCEQSAQYWVWKNYEKVGNPDYVGFMHYRRHFIFDDWKGDPEALWLVGGPFYYVSRVTPGYMEHLRDELILQRLQGQDCVVIKPYDVRHLKKASVREQYTRLPGQRGEWFDLLLDTVRRLYPDYKAAVDRLEKGSVQYLCNMFIMRRELFFEYSEFVFRVLGEVDRQVDSTDLSPEAKRFPGFLGEFCLTLYIFRAWEKGKLKILELNGSFLLSDEEIKAPRRKFLLYYLMSKLTFGKLRRKLKARRKALYYYIRTEKAFGKS